MYLSCWDWNDAKVEITQLCGLVIFFFVSITLWSFFMCPKFNFLLIQLFSKLPYDNYGICKGKPSLYLLWVEIMAVEDWKLKIREVLNVTLEMMISIVNNLGDVIIYYFFFKWGQRTLKYSGTQRLIQKCWSHELKNRKSLWLGFQSLEMEECEPDVKIRWMGR